MLKNQRTDPELYVCSCMTAAQNGLVMEINKPVNDDSAMQYFTQNDKQITPFHT